MVGVDVDESSVQTDCSLVQRNDGTHGGRCDVINGEGDGLPLVGEEGGASALHNARQHNTTSEQADMAP